jgi:hypothetical protein
MRGEEICQWRSEEAEVKGGLLNRRAPEFERETQAREGTK